MTFMAHACTQSLLACIKTGIVLRTDITPAEKCKSWCECRELAQLPAARRPASRRRRGGQQQRAQQPGAEPNREELRQREAAAQAAAEALLQEEEQAAAQHQAAASAKAARARAKRERQRQQRQAGQRAGSKPVAESAASPQPAVHEAPCAPRSPVTHQGLPLPSAHSAAQLAAALRQQGPSKPAIPAVEDSVQEVPAVHVPPAESPRTATHGPCEGTRDLAELMAQLGIGQPSAGDNVHSEPLA